MAIKTQTLLASLSFGTANKVSATKDDTISRRAKLLEKIVEQEKLFADPNFKPSRKRAGGVMKDAKITAWWYEDTSGLVLIPKYGAASLEVIKGKPAIMLKDRAAIPETLKLLIEATKAGEFDAAIKKIVDARGSAKAEKDC